MRFSVLQHKLVPEHRILTQKEAKEVLEALRMTKDQLPKIRKDDPVVATLERILRHLISRPPQEREDYLKQLPKSQRSWVEPLLEELKKNKTSADNPVPEGTVIRVTRLSETGGVFEAYRLVIGR